MPRRKITSLRQLIKGFAREQDGVAAVEFALIGLPFFWLILIVFETAGVIFTDIALQNGVIETARLIRTGQVQNGNIGAGEFKTRLCANVASYIDCSKIRVDVSKSADLPISATNMMTVDENTAEAFQPGGPSEWVMVQVRYDWKLAVPGISLLSNTTSGTRRLVAGAMFRNEPYGG
jgi:Flp pilus assembly protein TadG